VTLELHVHSLRLGQEQPSILAVLLLSFFFFAVQGRSILQEVIAEVVRALLLPRRPAKMTSLEQKKEGVLRVNSILPKIERSPAHQIQFWAP